MLFRKEVTEFRQSFRAGEVLLLKGWSPGLIFLITVVLIVALLSFLIIGNYTRRVTVNGEISTWPHTINLFAPEQGIVSRLLVAQGEKVTEGMALYELDVSRRTHTGNLSATTRRVLENQRKQTGEVITQTQRIRRDTLAALQQQIDQLTDARTKTQTMVASSHEGLNAMRASMEDYNSFRRRGLINIDQENNQRYLYYQQQSMWHNLNAQVIQQDMQISTLRSEIITRAADFDSQITQYLIRRDDIDRQLAEADASGIRLITAPSAGQISALSVTEGQMVSMGDSLAQLVPQGTPRLYLVAWLPNDSVPWVKPGDSVNIRYAAWPSARYGQFPGKVVSVSAAPVSARELAGYPSAPRQVDGGGAWFKTLIAVDRASLKWKGRQIALASGMQAQVTFFLEKRPLYQWILSPYYSLQNSIRGPVSEPR